MPKPKQPFAKAPDIGTIEAFRSQAEQRFAARNQYFEYVRRHRHRQTGVAIPEEYRTTTTEIRLPMAGDIIQRIKAMFAGNPLHVQVIPAGNSPRDQELSDKIERWILAAIEEMDARRGRQTDLHFIDALCEVGLGVLKVIYKPTYWQGFPFPNDDESEDSRSYLTRRDGFLRGAGMPFALIDVDPATVYPFYDEHGLATVIEMGDVDKVAVRRAYGLGLNERGELVDKRAGITIDPERAPDDLAGYAREIHYWDRVWYVHMVDHAVVQQLRHDYGRPPYWIAEGITTNSRRPEEASRSVADPYLPLIEVLNGLFTMYTNAAWHYGYPTPVLEFAPDSLIMGEDGTPKHFTFERGRLNYLPAGAKLVFPFMQADMGKMVDKLIEALVKFGEKSTLAPILYGHASSEATGYLANQLRDAAMGHLKPLVRNAAFAWEGALRFILECLRDKVPAPVFLWGTENAPAETAGWLSLGPLELELIPLIRVTIKLTQDSDNLANAQMWSALQQQGFVDRNYVRERTGVADATAMEERVLVERYADTPEFTAFVIGKLMERLQGAPALPGGQQMPGGMPGINGQVAGPPPYGPGAPTNQTAGLRMDVRGESGPEPVPGQPSGTAGVGGRAAGAARDAGGAGNAGYQS